MQVICECIVYEYLIVLFWTVYSALENHMVPKEIQTTHARVGKGASS